MALVTPTPTNPTIATVAADIPAGTATGFRTLLNARIDGVEAKVLLIEAFLEFWLNLIGPGAVSGGAITAGTGLTVNVATLTAMVGSPVITNASQVVGGLAASATNSLFLRQDGTWTINTTGIAPATTDGHGVALLWGTATTGPTTVTSVSNTRATFTP